MGKIYVVFKAVRVFVFAPLTLAQGCLLLTTGWKQSARDDVMFLLLAWQVGVSQWSSELQRSWKAFTLQFLKAT